MTASNFGGNAMHTHPEKSVKSPRSPLAALAVALVVGTLITASAIAGMGTQGQFSGSPFFKSQQLGIGFETNLW